MRTVINNWPIVALRGVLATLLALFAYSSQGFSDWQLFEILSVAFIVLGLCAYGVFDGILLMWLALCSPTGTLKRFGLIEGVGSVLLGLFLATLLFIKVTTAWFVVLAVVQCWLMGMNELGLALHLRRHAIDRRGFVAAGLISVLFGCVALLTNDGTAHVAAVWLTWYGVLMALTHFTIAYRLRTFASEVHQRAAAA